MTGGRTRRQAQRDGLTLIEVMLAVAILGVGMAALLTGASRCVAVMKLSREYQEAQWVLELALLEHPIVEQDPIDEQEVDREDYDKYTFSREVEDDEDEDGLFVVRSRVRWPAGQGERTEEVVQYVFRPEEKE